MKSVIVVAHPDDETLWAGGLAARGGFDIICCSVPKTDPIRAWKFYNACKVLGANGKVLPFIEPGPNQPLIGLEVLDLNGYDTIYTHNKLGEYGHLHHKQVHEYIVKNYSYKKIFTFNVCERNGDGLTAQLPEPFLSQKMRALKCYDHCLPYEGKNIPKWQALLKRYQHIDLTIETFCEYKA